MERILFVDDESHILDALQRMLRKNFGVVVAEGGALGLEAIERDGPFAVVVSDMQMPEMNGVEFLRQVKTKSPDTVRLMLTGNADQDTAVTAINDADVYRFLNKPVEKASLLEALEDAAAEYNRRRTEKDMLEKTVQGSVDVMAQILSLSNPQVFGRSQRLAQRAEAIWAQMDNPPDWKLNCAALLSQIGCLGASPGVLDKIASGTALDESETKAYHASIREGADMLVRIPRLEPVAEIIRLQAGGTQADPYRREMPIEAHVLQLSVDIDELEAAGRNPAEIITAINARADRFDPSALEAAVEFLSADAEAESVQSDVRQLTDSCVLMQDVVTKAGVLLVCRGWKASESVRKHLVRAAEAGQIDPMVTIARV